MEFGLCTSLSNAEAAREAGWDYLEESVQGLLQGLVGDDEWGRAARAGEAVLPIRVCNGLVPGELKVVGPGVDGERLRGYAEVVVGRAAGLGIGALVFGSGAARTVPEGFDGVVARRQLKEFVGMVCEVGEARGVTILLEHLNRGECNVLNTFAECVALAREVGRPNLKVLVDTFHLWTEGEPLAQVAEGMGWLGHVHVGDLAGRLPPGEGVPASDYRPLFEMLKRGGYGGRISVEALGLEPGVFGRVLEFLRGQWREA